MANVVLVHGAWSDGSSWSKVVGPLQEQGHHVVAVQNPLTSLADDVAWTRRIIAEQDGPVALVGHSYGGAVISGASADNPQVAGLVFVAAYAPDEGETIVALGEQFDPTPGGAAIRATDDGWLTVDPDMFPEVLAGDVHLAEAAVLAAVQKPTHRACFGSPAGPAGWKSLPSTYIRSANDQMLDPMLQSWIADRAGAAVTELNASHVSPISRGAEVAEVIAGVL